MPQYDDYQTGYSGVTYTDIENLLGVTFDTTEQSVVSDMIKEVEHFVCSYCGRQFKPDTTYTERIYISADNYFLSNYPIKEVTKIVVDDETYYEKGQSSDWVLDEDFTVTRHEVKLAYPCASMKRYIEFEYSISKFWGEDLVGYIKRQVAQMYLSKSYGGRKVENESIGGHSVSFGEEDIKGVLSKYQKIKI